MLSLEIFALLFPYSSSAYSGICNFDAISAIGAKFAFRAISISVGTINNPSNRQKKRDQFLFSYRSTPCTPTGVSPAELLMKRKMHSRLSLLKEVMRNKDSEIVDQIKSRQLMHGDLVLVRAYQPKRWISGVVLAKEGEVLYQVRIPSGIVRKHIDQLKSAPNLRNAVFGSEHEVLEELREDPVTDEEQREEVTEIVADDEQQPSSSEVIEVSSEPTVQRTGAEPPLRTFTRAKRGQTTRFDDYAT